jgi:hypothetical protein
MRLRHYGQPMVARAISGERINAVYCHEQELPVLKR